MTKKLTKREALRILIKHAAANCAGVGCGVRTLPTRDEREQVKDAIQKVFHEAHGRKMDGSDFFNLRLP